MKEGVQLVLSKRADGAKYGPLTSVANSQLDYESYSTMSNLDPSVWYSVNFRQRLFGVHCTHQIPSRSTDLRQIINSPTSTGAKNGALATRLNLLNTMVMLRIPR